MPARRDRKHLDDAAIRGADQEAAVARLVDAAARLRQQQFAPRHAGPQLRFEHPLGRLQLGVLLHHLGEFRLRRVERRLRLGPLRRAAAARLAKAFELGETVLPERDLVGEARFMDAMRFAHRPHRFEPRLRREDLLLELAPCAAGDPGERRARLDSVVLVDEQFDAALDRRPHFALRGRKKFEAAGQA